MGYIEPPSILPGIHLSAHGNESEVNFPNAKIQNVDNVVMEKAVEGRKVMQKLMGKENVLAEAAKALVMTKSFVESLKSKTTSTS
ncbi:unnamed protein product [Wuchereria bancrofti]|uniref:Uncharacterized protein n=1 Tax=Wuchereria bancrofti TaxID=6293 RepID=A0A3P7DU75_WUCBA|nr:unnamed protein product [Wuchereria bancrofti]